MTTTTITHPRFNLASFEEMGKYRWELVTILFSGSKEENTDLYTCFWKRPKDVC